MKRNISVNTNRCIVQIMFVTWSATSERAPRRVVSRPFPCVNPLSIGAAAPRAARSVLYQHSRLSSASLSLSDSVPMASDTALREGH
jgi:hypothetical protein